MNIQIIESSLVSFFIKSNNRWCHVYLNQHNKKTWLLNIYKKNESIGDGKHSKNEWLDKYSAIIDGIKWINGELNEKSILLSTAS